MKTLSDFKKRIQVGVKVHTVNFNYGDFGIREITVKQSNGFAVATHRDGKIVNSWCHFPKASDLEIVDADTVIIFWEVAGRREAILQYRFIN